MATYGEQLLARLETKSRTRRHRRRLILLVPALVTSAWAVLDLLAARRAHLAAVDAGFLRRLVDPILPVAWSLAFVGMPLVVAFRVDSLSIGAMCAFLAGPIVTPMLFGAGGWHAWQIAVMAAILVLVLGAARERARTLPD